MRFKFSFAFSFALLVANACWSQDNSPYTRFGIGELRAQAPASLRGWGSVTAAFQDPYRFTINNPASLGTLDRSALQAGIGVRGSWLETADTAARFGNATPDYLTLAFSPPKKNWGLSLGLLPYSRVNYNVFQQNDTTNGLPRSVNAFNGSGGLYELYAAGGWRIGHLSLGAKAGYIFGNITNNALLVFDDTLNGFNTRYTQHRVFSGVTWKAGVQYYFDLPGNNRLQLGAAGHTAINVGAKRNYYYERFFYYLGAETPIDTVASAADEKGTVTIPAAYDVGLVYKHFASDKSDIVRWQAGVNFTQTLFDDYRSFGEADSLASAYTVSGGIEWTPREEAIEGFFNRVRYSVGGYYGTAPVALRNQTLNRYGVTLGFGIPVRRASYVDLSADFGVNGTTEFGLIRERFVRGTVGFTLADIWFLKRKYD